MPKCFSAFILWCEIIHRHTSAAKFCAFSRHRNTTKGNARLHIHGQSRPTFFYRNWIPQLTKIIHHSSYPVDHQNCPCQFKNVSYHVSCTPLSPSIAGKTNIKGSIIVFLWLPVGFLDVLCQENIGVEQLLDVWNVVVLRYIDTASHSHLESKAAPE